MKNEPQTISLSDLAFITGTSSANVSQMNAAGNAPKEQPRGERNSIHYEVNDVAKWIANEAEKKIDEAKKELGDRLKRLETLKNDE